MYQPQRHHLLIPQGSSFDSSVLSVEFFESVRLRKDAVVGDAVLVIDRSGIAIPSGAAITFDVTTVLTTAPVAIGATSIPVVALTSTLFRGAIGKVGPMNLTGHTINSTIRRRFGSTDTWTLPWVIDDAIGGRISPNLTNVASAAIPANSNFAQFQEEFVTDLQDEGAWPISLQNAAYVWDLEITAPSTRIKRYMEGWCLITSESTIL